MVVILNNVTFLLPLYKFVTMYALVSEANSRQVNTFVRSGKFTIHSFLIAHNKTLPQVSMRGFNDYEVLLNSEQSKGNYRRTKRK
jgi:hypothetical protein